MKHVYQSTLNFISLSLSLFSLMCYVPLYKKDGQIVKIIITDKRGIQKSEINSAAVLIIIVIFCIS